MPAIDGCRPDSSVATQSTTPTSTYGDARQRAEPAQQRQGDEADGRDGQRPTRSIDSE